MRKLNCITAGVALLQDFRAQGNPGREGGGVCHVHRHGYHCRLRSSRRGSLQRLAKAGSVSTDDFIVYVG